MSGVKDYIIDIEKQQEEVREAKQRATPKVEYTLVLENDMDFVIKRKSARSDKDLVFLVSQELFYIKDNKKLTDAQVLQLSYRQIVMDKLTEYRILCDKRQESYDKLIQKRNDEYENQSARKLSAVDKKVYLSGDYASLNRQIKLISRQISYLEETIKTLDNLGFGIKNRIEIVNSQLM